MLCVPGDEALLLIWQLIAYVANDSWFLCFATDSLADSQRVRQQCVRTYVSTYVNVCPLSLTP